MQHVSVIQTPFGPMKLIADDSMPKDSMILFTPGQLVFRTHYEGPHTGDTTAEWIRKPSYVLLTNIGVPK